MSQCLLFIMLCSIIIGILFDIKHHNNNNKKGIHQFAFFYMLTARAYSEIKFGGLVHDFNPSIFQV